MSRLTRDGTAEPVSRDEILRRERGQGNINFPCSADHEQEWQPSLVDPYFYLYDVFTFREYGTWHLILLILIQLSVPCIAYDGVLLTVRTWLNRYIYVTLQNKGPIFFWSLFDVRYRLGYFQYAITTLY